ncbi:glycosyltransferase family 1 protein [Clostridiales bacterium TF09-2AC]|nr:glycosyltransferase family 1 protein [Clostridiales bacterium TF09-2AC]
MKKKALLVTTVSGFVPQFEMNNVHILESMGYEIHYAANFHMPSYGVDNKRLEGTRIECHQIDFCRNPFNKKNIKAYIQLTNLMEQENFSLIHCHTPMGGALGRLAARKAAVQTVIYTAHGFHFYKGAPLINWLIYYPAERMLARYTHQLICINQEDYLRARKFSCRSVNYVSGVGIDIEHIKRSKLSKDYLTQKRRSLGIPDEKTILLSVGELIPRKNHATVIQALKLLDNRKLCYVICGHGILEDELKALAKRLDVMEQVYFLGYRNDILELYQLADLFLLPSFQEGLSVALMEAMASGIPVIGSDIRGNRDLLGGSKEGLVKKNTPSEYAAKIHYLLNNGAAREALVRRGLEAIKKYDIQQVEEEMRDIYSKFN